MADRLAALTGRVDRLAIALDPSPRAARLLVDVAAPPLQVEIDRIARDAFGSDLRAFKGDNTKATAKVVTRTNPNGLRMTFELRPARAWQYAQKGAGRHLVGDQGDYVKAARAAHPVRGPVVHPGTKGRRTITRTRERIRDGARDAVLDGIRAVIRETDNG
jgi:hypothetical protein